MQPTQAPVVDDDAAIVEDRRAADPTEWNTVAACTKNGSRFVTFRVWLHCRNDNHRTFGLIDLE